MNNALSLNSILPQCFDTKVGPGACLFSDDSILKVMTDTLYQKIYGYFFVPDSLCGELKIKPRDCTGSIIFKPFAELFSWTISSYDTSNDSPQSLFNSFLARLRYNFHQKSHAVQSAILSKIDQLNTLFTDCGILKNDKGCRRAFEEKLQEAERLTEKKDEKSTDLSKLLSHYSPTNDKMLLHVVGDSFGSLTGLEGLTSFEAAYHLIYFFSIKLLINPEDKQAQHIVDTLTRTLNFSNSFYNTLSRNFCKQSPFDYDSKNAPCFKPEQLSRIQSTSSILKDELEKIEVGKPLYLIGGWEGSDAGPGHGMIYKFSKQKDSNLYSFEIINMGAGLENHFKFFENGALKMIPFVGKKNIPLASLTSDTFVSALYEIYTFYLNYDATTSSNRKWTPEQLYIVLSDSILEGDPYTDHITYADWIQPQHSGTCAFRSLIEIFGKEMTPFERAKFETELGIWSIMNYISGLDLRYTNASRLDFILKSIHAYSLILSNNLKSHPNLLSQEDLKEIRLNLKFVQRWAEIFDRQIKSDLNLGSNSLALLPIVSPITIPSFDIDLNHWRTDTSELLPKFEIQPSLQEIPLENLASSLLEVSKDLNEHLKLGQTDYVILSIQALIKKIHPMDVSKLSDAEKESTLTSLYEISKILFLSSIENSYGYLMMPEKYLSMLKISDLMTRLVTEDQIKELGFDSLSFLFMGFEKTVVPSFFFLNPKTLLEYESIKKSLAEKGCSFNDIPRLFEDAYFYHDLREESSLALDHEYPLLNKESTKSFLPDVLLKSIVRQLKKENSRSQLWDITGKFLLNYQDKLIDLSSTTPPISSLWKRLIQQALMTERFSSLCLKSTKQFGEEELPLVDHLRFKLMVKKDYSLNLKEKYLISIKNKLSDENNKFYFQDKFIKQYIPTLGRGSFVLSLLFRQNSKIIDDQSGTANRDKLESFPEALSFMETEALKSNLPSHVIKGFRLSDATHQDRDFRSTNSYYLEGDEIRQIIKYNKLRIERVIAYYENPFNFDSDNESQNHLFLTLALTSDRLLFDEFSRDQDGPLLAKKIARFIKNNFEKALLKENVKAAVFFSSLFRSIEKYFVLAQPSLESPFAPMDAISQMTPLLKNSESEDLDLALAYGEFFLIQSEDGVNDAKQASELVSHYLNYISFLGNYQDSLERRKDADHELSLQYLEIQNAFFDLLPSLQNVIEQHPDLLSNAIKSIYKDSSLKDRWETHPVLDFPYFVCKEKQLTLNLFKGVLASSKGELVTHMLPKKILKHDLYKTFFKNQEFEAKKIGPCIYEFRDSIGNTYQTKMSCQSYSDDVQIKKISQGKEFFLLNSNALKSHYDKSKMKIPNLSLFQEYRAWMSKDKSILFVEPDSLEEVFYYNPKSEKGVINLRTKDSLIDPTKTHLNFLSSFERPYFINIFGKQSNGSSNHLDINFIEFPRFLSENGEHLKFKRLNTDLQCINFPNLFLSVQKSPFYQETDPVLILEDRNKKPTLALMAPFYYGESTKTNPAAALETSIPLHVYAEDPKRHFYLLEYDLIENPSFNTDKTSQPYLYSPRSREGALYLAFSYLRLHEYQKAFETLLPLKSQIQKFNDTELKAASAILEMDQYNKDFSPQASSVKTLLSYILFNQKGDEDLPENIVSKAEQCYRGYLNQKTFHDLMVLDPYEELLLIENFQEKGSQLKSRYLFLSKTIDFSSMDLPSRMGINSPTVYAFKASKKSIDDFLSFIEKTDLAEFKAKALSDLGVISKDYYLTIPFIGSLFNTLTPTSSAHYSPSPVYLPEFFSTLYKIAKESNNSESAPLINLKNYILFLKKVFINGGSPQLQRIFNGFADFLWLVLQRPGEFPSSDEFNEWIFDYIKAKGNSEEIPPKFIAQLKSKAEEVLNTVGDVIQPAIKYQNIDSIPLPQNEIEIPFRHHVSNTKPLNLVDIKPTYEKELKILFKTSNYSFKDAEITPLDNTLVQIQRILSKPLEDSYEQSAFEIAKRDCEHYMGEIKPKAHALGPLIRENELLVHLGNRNAPLLSKQRELVASLEKEMLKLANKENEDEFKKELRKLEEIANRKTNLSVHDLIILFQQQSSEVYLSANPALSDDEIQLLNSKIASYLVEANFLQKLNRLQSYISKYLKGPNDSSTTDKTLQKVIDMAFADRSYDITKNPSYLVYEHIADIQLYPKQVEKLQELKLAIETQSSPQQIGLIIEAIMGFGKSIVMLPLLALHISNLGRLPLVVMPDSLIESLGSEIMTTLQPMNKQINVVEINRGTECSLEELQILYVKLKLALENHETLIFSSKSLQILFLKYIEFFSSIETFGAKETKAVRIFQEIFKTLKMSAIPIFDEADLLFNCRHETHFSLNNPIPIEDNHIQISSLIFKLILENADEIPYNFDYLDFNAEKETLSTSKYHQDLKPYLIDKLVKLLSSGDVFKVIKIKEWIEALEDKKALVSYLMGIQNIEMDAFIEGIQDEKIAHIIALAQAQLNLFLPLTINKKLLEHYGASKNNGRIYAIPYQHGKASDQSEFGNPYETINYTIQTYLQQGVPRKIIDKELKILSAELLELSTQMPGVNLEEFDAYKKMLSIYPHFKGFHLTEAVLQEVHEYINHNPTEKLRFIQNQILPNIQTYTQRISSNAQTFKMLFSKMIGFTGTMWNAETYPEGLDVIPADGIIGNTLTQFMKKSKKEVFLVEKEQDSFEQIGNLIRNEDTKAWIDLSGHFDFMPRLEVVKKILEEKKRQGILGVAFYDENDELMVLHEVEEPPVPFALSFLKDFPEKRFTLYDHQRITGANVSQDQRARALVTVGKHLILRDLAQAAWRMRGLEKDQAVDFVTTSSDQQAMLSLLNLPEDHILTVSDIIQYSILNQQHKKASDNLLSQKQKIVAVMQEHVFKMLTDQHRAPEEVFALFNKFKKLFVQNISDAPREQFGYPETLQSTEKILKEFILHLEMLYASLFGNDWNSIYEKMNEIIALEIMPQKMLARKPISTTALEQNVEVKLKQEVQSQVEREIEENYQIEKKYMHCNSPEILSWEEAVFKAFPAPLNLEELVHQMETSPLKYKPAQVIYHRKYKDWEADIDAKIASRGGLIIHPYEHYLPQAKAFFSSNILIENALTSEGRYGEGSYVLNGMCSDRCHEVLCFQTSQGLKMLMLDGKSALDWKEFIQSCDDQNIAPSQLPSFLLNLQTGAIELPNEESSFDLASKILESKEFKILKIQAKILSGEIYFKHDEIKLIEEWIKENEINKEELRKFILDYTISYYPKQVTNFKISSFHRLLVEEKTTSIKV